MSRIDNVTKNFKYAVFGQISGLIIGFIGRYVFIRTLGAEYLGLNGLFANILSILSLAELGIGPAMVYSMYKPLAENDQDKVNALMFLYRKLYVIIGLFIALTGLILTPFLGYFIKNIPDVNNIKIIYILFVFNSSISYFFSYKRSLIIADQKRFIATYYRYGFYFVLNIAQIIILILTRNYLIYLMLLVTSTILENIFISNKANQLYPFLKEKNDAKLNDEEKKSILRNIKAMMCHKLGSTVVMGTDNLLISKFVGLVQVGLYSNYYLITSSLNIIFGLLFQSLTASIGNLGVLENERKKLFTFQVVNFVGFWIYAFSSICLFILLNPFISLWIGNQYLFSLELVSLIVLNFYLTGMRKSVLTYRDALGLFWYDRYKPVFEAMLNLVFSIFLVKRIGISGIFLGTAMSTITVCFWVEPFILYKYGFERSVKAYFMIYIKYTMTAIFIGCITWILISCIHSQNWTGFTIKLLLCIIIPNCLLYGLFSKSDEFKYLLEIFKKKIIF